MTSEAEPLNDRTIIQQNQLYRFEWTNFRRSFRERVAPDGSKTTLHLIQVEVSGEDWRALETMPGAANGEFVMNVTDVTEPPPKPEKPKKPPKPTKDDKGPHWRMWELLFRRGFINAPGVRETIEEKRGTTTEPAKEVLHRVFGVGGGSLSTVGREDVYKQFPPNEYPRIHDMVEAAYRDSQQPATNNPTNNEGDEYNGIH